ncbi:MAG: DUF2807 domain-containing protein [Sphingobacteriales bacterium]|nr:DUF2807 domain-containing protein [Sphingobacteriales bacterium]
MKRTVVFLLACVMVLGSCRDFFGRKVRGNGNIKTESRTVDAFNGVRVSGAIDIYVRQDSVRSVRVEADENLQQYVEVGTDGNMLEIHPRSGVNLRPTRSIRVYVGGPDLSRFNASGACDIISENKITSPGNLKVSLSGACDTKLEINAPDVEVSVSGAGSVTLKGETRNLRVDGSGSTDIKCFDLMAENVNVDISGAGNAEVFASVKLDVDVSGAADVRYKGNATVNQRISGAGTVRKKE